MIPLTLRGRQDILREQDLMQRFFPRFRSPAAGFLAVCMGLVVFWMVTQTMGLLAAAGTSARDGAQSGTPVALLELRIEDGILIERQFLGRLEALQSADLSFDQDGVIDAVFLREGDMVAAGDRIARLTAEALDLERQALSASLSSAQSRFQLLQAEEERLQRLVAIGASPSNTLDRVSSERLGLASEMVELESALARLDLRRRNAELIAPFDGVIGALRARQGETVSAGQPMVSLFERGGAQFRVALHADFDATTLVDPHLQLRSGRSPVKLARQRPDVDPRTNMRIAIFTTDEADLTSFGATAMLIGQEPLALRGAWVPVEAMRASAEGFWIVLAVDDDMIAQRVAVEVLHLRGDQAFVSGVFETGTRIIGPGAHKVVAGQRVRAE
ncbi:MAG: efflux RND transporter periplasmic adaptor subunit [Rhodobacteraceae bacterium]|nr:MAG: efflux RND transporter periplasmic adaptor subunit [Paracoccaceae bacterium]